MDERGRANGPEPEADDLRTGYEPPAEPAARGAGDADAPREHLEDEPTVVFEPDPSGARTRGMLRGLVDEIFYAGVGAVTLTKDRVDELVDELAGRGALTRDEAREVVEDANARWRGEAARVGERASVGLAGMFRELGLVTRREWEELDLRLAQVEHRLRLVERERADATPDGAPPAPGGARRGRHDRPA